VGKDDGEDEGHHGPDTEQNAQDAQVLAPVAGRLAVLHVFPSVVSTVVRPLLLLRSRRCSVVHAPAGSDRIAPVAPEATAGYAHPCRGLPPFIFAPVYQAQDLLYHIGIKAARDDVRSAKILLDVQ